MSGPRPKPDDRRQRRNMPKKPTVKALPSMGADVVAIGSAPEPGAHWLPAMRDEWKALWAHPITAAYDRTLHEAPLRIIFELRDERERLNRIVRECPMVEGSQGQERANPLYARLGTVDSELRQREAAFGLNPKALLDLGITFGTAKKTLADLSRGDDDDDTGEEDEEDDPRIVEAELVEETPQAAKRRGPRADAGTRRGPVDGEESGPRPG